jgi:uncharacterized membrane protein YqjE
MTTYSHDATEPLEADRSLGELFGELSREFSSFFNAHIELAKVELREEAQNATRTAAMFGAAALAAFMALVLLSFAAAWGLAEVMPTGFAFLIVGAIWTLAALILALSGRTRAKQIGKPEETIDTLKEDAQWARQIRN